MTTETVREPASSSHTTNARRWWILGVVGLAQVMVILDTTVVNIALPSAQRALRFSNGDRQWVITKTKARLDIPGTLAVSSGLAALVYGFSQARSKGWSSSLTIACLAASVVLLALFVTRLGLHSKYATDVLPALVLIGIGLGFVVATAINTATAGVRPADSGIASALVNTSQQIGGSVGTALLNTLATTAAASFLISHGTGQAALARATIHGNSVAFWAGGGVFAAGAVVCGLMVCGRSPRPAPDADPALACHWSLGGHRPRSLAGPTPETQRPT